MRAQQESGRAEEGRRKEEEGRSSATPLLVPVTWVLSVLGTTNVRFLGTSRRAFSEPRVLRTCGLSVPTSYGDSKLLTQAPLHGLEEVVPLLWESVPGSVAKPSL